MTTPVQPVTLEQIRHDWTSFTILSDKTSFAYCSMSGGNAAAIITAKALRQIDPRLPIVMARYADSRTGVRACALLQKTISLWLDSPLLLQEHQDNMSADLYGTILSVTTLHAHHAVVTADVWLTRTGGDPVHTYVYGDGVEATQLPYAWLEQQCPGSVQRLKIAAGLELTGQALHNYVFAAPTPEEDIILPDSLCSTLVASA